MSQFDSSGSDEDQSDEGQTLEEMFDARIVYRTRELARSNRSFMYWVKFERCGVCGVAAGLPCHSMRSPAELRDEVHFYRERVPVIEAWKKAEDAR